jgi:replication factor C subunit 2/4
LIHLIRSFWEIT